MMRRGVKCGAVMCRVVLCCDGKFARGLPGEQRRCLFRRGSGRLLNGFGRGLREVRGERFRHGRQSIHAGSSVTAGADLGRSTARVGCGYFFMAAGPSARIGIDRVSDQVVDLRHAAREVRDASDDGAAKDKRGEKDGDVGGVHLEPFLVGVPKYKSGT